jgi:hypothetical protein
MTEPVGSQGCSGLCERRIDVVEFVTVCSAIGADPAKILKGLTKAMGESS